MCACVRVCVWGGGGRGGTGEDSCRLLGKNKALMVRPVQTSDSPNSNSLISAHGGRSPISGDVCLSLELDPWEQGLAARLLFEKGGVAFGYGYN